MKVTKAFNSKNKTVSGRNSAVAKEKSITLDYPQEQENICSRGYSLRITTEDEMRSVSVSIDGGDLRPCREAVGYWWYDWSGYEEGKHQVSVSAQTHSGENLSCGPRVFQVVFEAAK